MPSTDRTQLLQVSGVIVLALLLLGTTCLLLLLGREVPAFLIGFDGVIVTAAFGSGPFLGAQRVSLHALAAARDTAGMHHALAIAVAQKITGGPTNGNEPASGVAGAETRTGA